MGNEESYQKLAVKYGPTAGGQNFLNLCAEIMTPDECDLILEIFSTPMTPAVLAKKLAISHRAGVAYADVK